GDGRPARGGEARVQGRGADSHREEPVRVAVAGRLQATTEGTGGEAVGLPGLHAERGDEGRCANSIGERGASFLLARLPGRSATSFSRRPAGPSRSWPRCRATTPTG